MYLKNLNLLKSKNLPTLIGSFVFDGTCTSIIYTKNTLNLTHTLGQVWAKIFCPNLTPIDSLFPIDKTMHKKLMFCSNSSGQESERRPLCVNRVALEIRNHGRQTSGKTDNCGHANACPNDRKHDTAAPARMLPTVARLLLLRLTSSSIGAIGVGIWAICAMGMEEMAASNLVQLG